MRNIECTIKLANRNSNNVTTEEKVENEKKIPTMIFYLSLNLFKFFKEVPVGVDLGIQKNWYKIQRLPDFLRKNDQNKPLNH